MGDWRDRRFLATGIAVTAIEAEAEARASIAAVFGSSRVSARWPATFASEVYQREAVKRQAARTTKAAKDTAGVEYLYPDLGGDAEAFKELQRAYEDAMKMFKC